MKHIFLYRFKNPCSEKGSTGLRRPLPLHVEGPRGQRPLSSLLGMTGQGLFSIKHASVFSSVKQGRQYLPHRFMLSKCNYYSCCNYYFVDLGARYSVSYLLGTRLWNHSFIPSTHTFLESADWGQHCAKGSG